MTISDCPIDLGDVSGQPTTCPHDTPASESTLAARSRPVPHITSLKGEVPAPTSTLTIRPDGRGIGYRDEHPGERDKHEVLWVRTSPPAAGRPIPLFRTVHPARSRDAMLGMLCQVCFKEPSRTHLGTLFIMMPAKGRDMRFWPDTEYTNHPPTCLPCAQQALVHCPFVREAKAIRVKNPQPWGVTGIAYYRGEGGRLCVDPVVDRCAYSDLRLAPWMLATQPVARLSRCTKVDLINELTTAGLEIPESTAP